MNETCRRCASTRSGIVPGLAAATILLLSAACVVRGTNAGATSDAVIDPELAGIMEAVHLTYEVSSFADATTADPEVFRTAFTPTAKLAYTSGGRLVERSVDEYVEVRRRMMASGEVTSLAEWEMSGRTEHFGNVAHHFSTYAARVDGQDELAERGVMSFQLVRVDDRWLVHSLTWQTESDDLRLRSDLLPPEMR